MLRQIHRQTYIGIRRYRYGNPIDVDDVCILYRATSSARGSAAPASYPHIGLTRYLPIYIYL